MNRLMVIVSKCALVPRLAPIRFTDKTEIQEKRNRGLLVLTLDSARVLLVGHYIFLFIQSIFPGN